MREYKWPSDRESFGTDFRRVFKMSIVDFYDPLMSWIMKKFTIKIDVFDAKLHQEYGEYEERGLSMKDIISLHYGPEGVELIEALI